MGLGLAEQTQVVGAHQLGSSSSGSSRINHSSAPSRRRRRCGRLCAFPLVGKSWIDQRFKKELEEFKHEKNKELEQLPTRHKHSV